MPESKTRHPHKHTDHHPKHSSAQPHPKKISKIVIATVLFCGVLGLGISYFIASDSIATLLLGTLIGATVGYIFGHEVDKSFSKK